MSLETCGWLILACPLAGCLVISLGYRLWSGRVAGVIGTLAIAAAFVASIGALLALEDLGEEERQVVAVGWNYANTAGVDAQVSLLLDPLSILMALVVSGVSTLIHLYSVSYMKSDRGYARFFAYLNFFVFSMLLLVLAGNFLMLIVGWAFVGAASYLLISFWYRRTTATRAGIKAFVINVVGDVGLVIGTYFIFKGSGSLDFLTTFRSVGEDFTRNDGDLVAGCIGLLVGAFAKSAQVPLHTWLPDAMEGPTPVSALIHAATMVTAGVYLIARMHPLFEQAPAAAAVGAIIGCATLLIAASIAMVVTDLKRVIAYSTMSQIGYMIMAVSSAAYTAGLFHLMTHAFFKALLFMGAGSVIAAMANNQNLDEMGGFRKALPYTFLCMLIGGLALSGFPPLSGYFSKDDILAFVAARDDWHVVLAALGFVGSFLTAVYTFRMIFRTFWGEEVEPAHVLRTTGHLYHAHEPTNPATGEVEDTDVGFPGPDHHIAEHEGSMKIAMGALAVLSIIGGVLQIPKVTDVLHEFLEPTFSDSRFYNTLEPSNALTTFGLITGALLSAGGIALAYLLWVRRPEAPGSLRARLAPLHRFFFNKWYFDEAINTLIVRPFAWFGRFARNTFERIVISGLFVGGTTGAVRAGSAAVRAAQSGYLRYYAALLLLGLTALGLYFLLAAS
jgi:NADH-quinone oxidoreductase subunit L